ncbi:MAG: hypothetical protein HY305_02315, partial [Sphingobacteriales bacterium]|nr:hypothetical protein [Sphingobacteriales bacterium]
EKFTWSSYQYYIGKNKKPDWLTIEFIQRYFEHNNLSVQDNYANFVLATITACPNGNIVLPGVTPVVGNTYQWQVNAGGGCSNIANGTLYSGATFLYGYKYRCAVTNNSLVTYSTEYVLAFVESWTGAVSNAWGILVTGAVMFRQIVILM